MTGAVVFLCDYQAPYGGNFIASLRALEQALSARGVPAVYLLPKGAGARTWCGALADTGSTVEFFDDRQGAPAQAGQIRAVCKKHGAGILHVHFGKYAASAAAALLLPGLRLVWHYHSDFSAGKKPSPLRRVKRWALGAFCRVFAKRVRRVAVSPHIAAGLPGSTVILNALAPDRLITRHAGRAETRAALSLSDAEYLVLQFGWSPHVKGVDTAVNAVALLCAQGVRVRLGLVGGREYPPARMKEWIAQHTQWTGEEPFLLHLPPTEDVFAYHEAADAMLSASRSEAFSYALIEALFALRPCVSTDIPGVMHLAGCPAVFFTAPEDAARMADAIKKACALSRDAAGAPLLREARAFVEKRYAVARWVEDVLAVYGS